MSDRRPAYLFFIAALIFLFVGLRNSPANSTYIVLGIVFFILGSGFYRRRRPPD